MADYTFKKCSECGQQLRIPKNIGGMLMECPSCGKKFGSDFKIGGAGKHQSHNIATTLFELPYTLWERIYRFFSKNLK